MKYKIQKGDTLSKIAIISNTTVDILVKLNDIKNVNNIIVGTIIELPEKSYEVLNNSNIKDKVKKYINLLEGKTLKKPLSSEQIININNIFQKCLEYSVTDLRMICYILATVQWETNRTFKPIEEIGKGRGKPYGIPHFKTNHIYYGRGFIQLTWYDNYERFRKILKIKGINVDLINNPEKAQDPEIATIILVLGMKEGKFTGRDLDDYFNSTKEDWYNARRIVNGVDKAVIIKEIALENYYILK
jgi:putative chitinase